MKLPFFQRSAAMRLICICVLSITLFGCSSGAAEPVPPTVTPVPPTATALPTATPVPTATLVPTAEAATASDSSSRSESATATSADPIAAPTPEVTIPNGYAPHVDSGRGYSLAVPGGWTELDLRSGTFQNLARTANMGDQLGPLNEFLDSEAGQALGVIYITDLSAVIFGGLPTLLNVSVVDAPGATPDAVIDILTSLLEQNAGALGDVTIRSMESEVINNIPAVKGAAVADLSQAGMDAELFAKVVGLIANDKIYVLTMATQSSKEAKYDPVFDQIIGTFRPE